MASSLTIANNLTAAGTVQTDALLLSASSNYITSVASGSGVRLPSLVTGVNITVTNNAPVNAVLVYPPVGARINALSTNAAFTLVANQTTNFISLDGVTWNTGSTGSSYGSGVPLSTTVQVTATSSLTAAQSGSFINLAGAAAAVNISLPTTLSAGLEYEFVVTAALANPVTVNAGSALIKGNAVATNGVVVVGPSGTARQNVIFGTGSVIGDTLRIRCVDGATWQAVGNITTNTTMTVS